MTILNEKYETIRFSRFISKYIYRTLDILSTIDLTYENLDPTSLLYYDDNDDPDHIWILLRSTSNTLQAWNQSEGRLHGTISLNNLFEKIGKTDEQLAMINETLKSNSNHDDEENNTSNPNDHIRITSFLIYDKQLWIGTSTGIIFVFNYTLQRKLSLLRSSTINIRTFPRSFSVTSQMIDDKTRHYLSRLPDLVNNNKKSRSRSDSAMIELYNSSDDCWSNEIDYSSNRHLYRITFPVKIKDHTMNISRRRKRHNSTINSSSYDNKKLYDHDSGDTSTTLTSIKTHSSSAAVISTDEWCNKRQNIKLPSTILKQQKSLEPSATFSFNLVFKAKIADAPVKCICKTKYRYSNTKTN